MSDIHICRGVNRQFAAFVRLPGCKNYELVGKWSRSQRVASMRLAKEMLNPIWKRGIVAFRSDYYDPVPVLWVNR